MLLAYAVIAGFIAGSLRAASHQKLIQVPDFAHTWIVFVAIIPQLLAFEISLTSKWMPIGLAKVILVGSQGGLLIFSWINRKSPYLWIIGLGLSLNLLVIILNGGLMPISPQAASHVYPNIPVETWEMGSRLGTGKDVVLPEWNTQLAILADRFHLPAWLPYRAAFSLGDAVLAVGTLLILWHAGNIPTRPLPSKTGI